MLQRKPRYAQYELDRMSISELKRLLPLRYRTTVTGLFSDKRDLIEYLIDQGFVDLIRAPPPMEFPHRAFLRTLGVGQLKQTMNETGVYFDPKDVVEKEDMVQIFVNSGRICLVEPEPEDETVNNDNDGTDGGYGHAAFDRPQQFPHMGPDDDDDENASDASDVGNGNNNSIQNSNTQDANRDKQGTKKTITVETVEESVSDDLSTNNDVDGKSDNRTHDGPDEMQDAGTENVETIETIETARKKPPTVVVETVDEDDELASPSQSFQDTNNRPTEASWNRSIVMEEAVEYNNDINNNQAAADERDSAFVDRDETPGSESSKWESIATAPATNDNNINFDDPMETEDSDSAFVSVEHIPEPAAAAASAAENSENGMDTSSESERKRPRQNDENSGGGDNSDSNGDRTRQFQYLSISDMRNLAQEQGIDISSCIERKDIEERLASVVRQPATAVSTHAQMQDEQDSDDDNTRLGGLTVDTFQKWSVSHLRACGHSMDVDLSKCTTHEDMAAAMLTAATERPYVASYLASLTPLMSMKISELRALARERGVKVSDCLEKGEMITRLATAFESSSI